MKSPNVSGAAVAKRSVLVCSQMVFVAGLMLLWQWASTSGRIDKFFFGEPKQVWDILRTWAEDGTLLSSVWSTTRLVLIGFSLGLALGTVVGCLLALSRFFRDVFEPYLIFLNACPRVILYPFLLVWLGFDILPKIATIVLVMTTTVAINIAAGFKDIEDEYLANVRAMGASKFEVAKNVYIPSLALWLLATSRVTFAFAFQAAVFTEILGSTGGVGYLILVGQTNFDVDTMFAGMVLLTIVALIVEYLLGAVEQRTTRWRPA